MAVKKLCGGWRKKKLRKFDRFILIGWLNYAKFSIKMASNVVDVRSNSADGYRIHGHRDGQGVVYIPYTHLYYVTSRDNGRRRFGLAVIATKLHLLIQ